MDGEKGVSCGVAVQSFDDWADLELIKFQNYQISVEETVQQTPTPDLHCENIFIHFIHDSLNAILDKGSSSYQGFIQIRDVECCVKFNLIFLCIKEFDDADWMDAETVVLAS